MRRISLSAPKDWRRLWNWQDVCRGSETHRLGHPPFWHSPEPYFKIHEHDNTNVYKQFKLEGEIYTAEVHPSVTVLSSFWTTKAMKLSFPRKTDSSDFFRKGDNVRASLKVWNWKATNPPSSCRALIRCSSKNFLSRKSPKCSTGWQLPSKRHPRRKAKVAVDSYDDRIDPVSLWGWRAPRIHGIVRELGKWKHRRYQFYQQYQHFITRHSALLG